MFNIVNNKLSDVKLDPPAPSKAAEKGPQHIEEAKEIPAAAGAGPSAADSFVSSKTFRTNSE